MAMGTPLAVAKVLDVQPDLVYRWMAALEVPSNEFVGIWKQRLEFSLSMPKPVASHPRRRASDTRLTLVR